MRVTQLCFALAASLVSVQAHIALWDEGMYGWDPEDPNQSEPVLPLMHLPFNQWWFHGYINKPPQEGKFMELPSGGTYKGQVACNKALTTYGQNDYQQTGIYACDGQGDTGGIGAMHTSDQWGSPDPKDVKGCGIAIAYESDVNKIKPEDFTVISTNYTCPWFKDVDFHIPADLPPCPEGGCHCMWGWIHAADAGSEQNYLLGYRCNVTGATGVTPLPAPQTANKCDYPADTSNCTVAGKQMHFWYNERNNNPQGEYDPPFYNGEYGFMNGAQTDLFATVGGAQSSSSSSIPANNSGSGSSASSANPASTSPQVAASGAYGDAQPSTTASATSVSSSSAVANTDYTTQTTVTIDTTMVRPSDGSTTNDAALTADATINVQAHAAIATSVSTSNKTKTCSASKRKRHLERLMNSPELMKKHQARNQRRRQERLNKTRIEADLVQMSKRNL
ncbi:uncharacterized protein L201_004264 [Kwoniella dendrophila CBS 6074]|uniref:Uncharacterized protein n=1 Tax=Kwoniella dendrophila CBS 6074 TaxID=1295534 RepID=A0AAX4JWR0_9TREE